MPEQFTFARNDPLVQEHLTATEINGVTRWQSARLTYQFEFHTAHEKGWPCYLREPDGPGRNLPKMNVKVESWTSTVLEGKSIRDNQCGKDFKEVIIANVALFRKMAEHYYVVEVEEEEQAVADAPSWYAQFTCTKAAKTAPVFVRLPEHGQVIGSAFWSNMQRTAQRPICKIHKNSHCLNAEAVKISAEEAGTDRKQYDDYFLIT